MGVRYVPASERDRAEAALSGSWVACGRGSTSFELEGDRFARAHRELESVIYEDTAVNTVLAPVLGVALEADRWDLGAGLALVRGRPLPRLAEAVWGSAGEAEPNTIALMTVESRPTQPPPLDRGADRFQKARHRTASLEAGRCRPYPPWRGSAPTTGPGRRCRSAPRAALAGGPLPVLESSERAELVELFELARSRPRARRGDAVGADALRAGMRAAGRARRALRLPARGACPARPRRPFPTASPAAWGALRGAGPPPGGGGQRQQAFRLERLVIVGNVDAAYLESIGVGSADGVVRRWRRTCARCSGTWCAATSAPDLVGISDELLARRPAVRAGQDTLAGGSARAASWLAGGSSGRTPGRCRSPGRCRLPGCARWEPEGPARARGRRGGPGGRLGARRRRGRLLGRRSSCQAGCSVSRQPARRRARLSRVGMEVRSAPRAHRPCSAL